jgi:hypothetical protein
LRPGARKRKPSIGYAAFDPASGDVVSRRGNQVECPLVQRSQMKADHWIRGIRSRVWRCRQPQGKPGRKCPLVQRSQTKADHWIRGIRSRVWRCRQPQRKTSRNAHIWQGALTNETHHWIRDIRSCVWRCCQPEGQPGRNVHIWQGRSQMKAHQSIPFAEETRQNVRWYSAHK